jgi:hypothetical protein
MKERKPGESIVERTKGIFKSDLPPMTAEELRKDAEEAIAEEAERMNNSGGGSQLPRRGV